MNTFQSMTEQDRCLFIAKLHHAIWHDEQTFKLIQGCIDGAEGRIPKAEYFPKQDNHDTIRTSSGRAGLPDELLRHQKKNPI